MLKIVIFTLLLVMASLDSIDISNLFDSFLKDTLTNHQLTDGSLKTTYFNIPHRTAPGLIEPFIFSTHPTAAQFTVSNIRRIRPVSKEVRRQQVWDGEDYDYYVMATAVSIDIKVTNLVGDLTTSIDRNVGQYSLNGNLHDFVMNVTMQTDGEYVVLPTRDVVPTTSYMSVSGDGEERVIVESHAPQIVGDLATNLFHETFRASVNGVAGKSLENAVRAFLI